MVSGHQQSGMDACACDDGAARGHFHVHDIASAREGRDFGFVSFHGACVLGHSAARLVLHRNLVDVEECRSTASRSRLDLDHRRAENSARPRELTRPKLAVYAPACCNSYFAGKLDLGSFLTTIPSMNYRVTLFQSDEGWAVSCPDLPGCHSQGTTRDEALANIKEAIRLWLEVEAEETGIQFGVNH